MRTDDHGLWNRTMTRAWVRVIALTVYYVIILVGLVVLYGKGDFKTPPFVYQGF